jgi:hypothetical protein
MFPTELVVIGVHSAKFPSEQLTSNIRQAIMRYGIEHPVVNDAGFRIWNEYSINAWPTLVLIDPTGRIAAQVSGEIQAEDFAREVSDVIQQNLDVLRPEPLEFNREIQQEPERPLEYPARVLLAPGGTLFIADTGHHRIIQVQLDPEAIGERVRPAQGEVVRVFGSGFPGLQDGPAESARFRQPHGMALRDSVLDGTLYVADTENHAVRAIDLESGAVRTVAGTGQKAHGRFALGKPTEVPLRSPWAVAAFDQFVFIAMAGSHQIWVLIGEDQLGPFAGTGAEALVDGPIQQASFNQPSDLALGMGHLFVADSEASAIRAITLGENPGTITLVGSGLFEWGDKDGMDGEARLQHPAGLALDENILYIADTYNHKIKTLDPTTGQVTTLVGSGIPGMADGSFKQADFFEPEGLQVADGKIYIADTNNHLIRVADLDLRRVETLALRGLEKLQMPPEQIHSTPIVRLNPVTVGKGTSRLTLHINLPPGYKRNPDAPTRVQVDSQQLRFAAKEEISFPVEADSDTELPLELTLYYCQADNQGVCLIEDRRFILPMKVQEGGPETALAVYTVK